jgi:hypothetical protein
MPGGRRDYEMAGGGHRGRAGGFAGGVVSPPGGEAVKRRLERVLSREDARAAIQGAGLMSLAYKLRIKTHSGRLTNGARQMMYVGWALVAVGLIVWGITAFDSAEISMPSGVVTYKHRK